MTKVLSRVAIKENPWFAVILPLPESAPEKLVMDVFHVTALLSGQMQTKRAEALKRGDMEKARDFYKRYLEIEARADLAQAMLDRFSNLHVADLLDSLNSDELVKAPGPEAVSARAETKAEKPAKQLPPNVLPESAHWFKRQGGIDTLNAGERLVLAADYQAWAEKKPLEAAKHSEADYCTYRQKLFSQKARKRAQELSA